ncbi:acetyl-coenzyme A carboxylase carboxyl transferase subunit alpha, chloroplastic-like [Gossypium australe]|uniref:Acetyl-coenzyme A carboxylase carboxyl transferase subunit alpha, chloroplastic-like n=1 Tax=Gossypium australe TaxID=47621 RepID=A0A5B6W6U3_9ROSI|nr:acetyl-coenzyme A carboxylase carboxyl transferase subunit alpha, chloroplastic-like [Gossypium australe]
MSTRGCGRGHSRRGRGRGQGARVGSEASVHMPEMDVPASPVTETGSHDRMGGDDALSQAVLRVLERIARASTGSVTRGSISERLRSNGAEGGRTVAAYEVEFLRLSWYTRGIVSTEYERCMRFEDGLRDEFRVKNLERQNREKDRGKNKRDFGFSGPARGFHKRPRFEGPARVGVPATTGRLQPCVDCGKFHSGEC